MAWTARLKRLRDRAEQRFPVVTELTGRLLSTNLLDAATRLAAQAFLAAVPLLFAIAAFAPGSVRDQLRESLRAMFGLTGDADQELQKVLGSSTDTALSNSSGAIGLAVALVSATSFSRAMARVCERAWRLPRAGTRIAAWRWMVWLLVLVLVVILQGPIRNGFGAGVWLGTVLFFVVGTGVWLWTQHLLLAWPRLLAPAVARSTPRRGRHQRARAHRPALHAQRAQPHLARIRLPRPGPHHAVLADHRVRRGHLRGDHRRRAGRRAAVEPVTGEGPQHPRGHIQGT